MHPVLIDLGGFQLHTYGAMAALGFFLVVFVALRDADLADWDREAIIDLIFWTSLAAIGGSRGLYILQTPELLADPASWISPRLGGLVFYGAPLVGLPVAFFLLRRARLPAWATRLMARQSGDLVVHGAALRERAAARFGKPAERVHGLPACAVLDSFATVLPAAHGLSRLGCLGAGCCWGTPSSFPWAVTYDHPLAPGPHGVPVHPVQAYEAVALLALAGALRVWRGRHPFDGAVVLGWIGAYAVVRWLTELLRGDVARGFVLEGILGQTVSTSQGISLGLGALVVVGWAALRGRPRAAGRSAAGA